MLVPLVVVGGIALLALAQTAKGRIDWHTDNPPSDPVPQPDPIVRPQLPIGPPPPPDPRRQDRIARLFVLDTLDASLPPGGRGAIEKRYAMAADWVKEKVGRNVAYHPEVTYLQLPYTSDWIRRVVLSGAADNGRHERNNKSGSPLFGTPRRPASAYRTPLHPGGLPALIFDSLESYARIENKPLDNPRNPDLTQYNQNWMFIVRGAGGYAAGGAHYPGSRESVGYAICGDSVLTAWLSESTNERNMAHEVIFIDDTLGRHEWEIGWDKNNIDFDLARRRFYGTPNAQTGSFIHESFHAIFNAVHVSLQDLEEIGRANEWYADPVDNIMGGSHLDWPNTAIQQVTLAEIDDGDYYV